MILVPPPPAAWASLACIAVTAAEIGHVAQLLSERFHPLDASYAKFAEVVHDDTGAAVILRIGSRPIAGSQGIGPPVIPLSGPVTYQGKPFWVVLVRADAAGADLPADRGPDDAHHDDLRRRPRPAERRAQCVTPPRCGEWIAREITAAKARAPAGEVCVPSTTMPGPALASYQSAIVAWCQPRDRLAQLAVDLALPARVDAHVDDHDERHARRAPVLSRWASA